MTRLDWPTAVYCRHTIGLAHTSQLGVHRPPTAAQHGLEGLRRGWVSWMLRVMVGELVPKKARHDKLSGPQRAALSELGVGWA